MSSYVAFTRVKKMEDLLIYRPFARSLFNQGDLEGPNLLLKVLRGEDIDWKTIEEKHLPSHDCASCGTKQFKADFSEAQWKRKDNRKYCRNCEKSLSANGTRKQCKWCTEWKTENMYEDHVWKCRELTELWCKDCKEKRRCQKCGLEKLETEFDRAEWKRQKL